MSNIEEIKAIIAQAPDDPFPRYGLAMALRAEGRLDEARAAFLDLERRHPAYVPQYLMHGNLLKELGDRDEAKRVFDKGIEAARAVQSTHALSELEAARASLSEEEDE